MLVSKWTKIKRTVLAKIYIWAKNQYHNTRTLDMRCPKCKDWYSVSGIEYEHEYVKPEPYFGCATRCGKCGHLSFWNLLEPSEVTLCDVNGNPIEEGDDPFDVECEHQSMVVTSKMREELRNDTPESWDYDECHCVKCGETLGHTCPNSPDNVCHYYTDSNGMVMLVDKTRINPPDDHDVKNETDDECIYCGAPEERK